MRRRVAVLGLWLLGTVLVLAVARAGNPRGYETDILTATFSLDQTALVAGSDTEQLE